MLKKATSARSLFDRDISSVGHSSRSNKSDDLRKENRTATKLSAMESNRGSWATIFRGLRTQTQQNLTISRTFQKRAYSNADALVASLEVVILALSMIQLELSLRSPRWRENKVCLGSEKCSTLLDEGSFKIVNALRIGIVIFSLVRAWIRMRYLRSKRPIFMATSEKSIRVRLTYLAPYFVELLFTIVVPYPALEHMVPREHPNIIVFLTVATVIRTAYWRHLLFFPYPIRQKEKIAFFTGNLEFTYREFVLKKVFDDDPITKIVMVYTITLALASFLLHIVESVYGTCTWRHGASTDNAENMVCYSLTWNDSMWVVTTAFLSTGYGGLLPRSPAGQIIVSVATFAMKFVSALFFSIIIKKNKFSTMEARAHSFLFRMELNERKDLIAVMAVQATFRFNKSYKQSLIWHQQDQSRLYFRPLSARLPNEVKKKLYVSRFQASLKDMMKYNTDGDLLNAFTKHVEVITAALGISYVKMVSLKKVYYHKSRVLEDRRRRAQRATSRATMLLPTAAEGSEGGNYSEGHEVISSMRGLGILARFKTFQGLGSAAYRDASVIVSHTNPMLTQRTSQTSPRWQTNLLKKCDETLHLLQKIQTNVQTIK